MVSGEGCLGGVSDWFTSESRLGGPLLSLEAEDDGSRSTGGCIEWESGVDGPESLCMRSSSCCWRGESLVGEIDRARSISTTKVRSQ